MQWASVSRQNERREMSWPAPVCALTARPVVVHHRARACSVAGCLCSLHLLYTARRCAAPTTTAKRMSVETASRRLAAESSTHRGEGEGARRRAKSEQEEERAVHQTVLISS